MMHMMALRLLRASSANLARHSQRPISTSSPLHFHPEVLADMDPDPDPDANANANAASKSEANLDLDSTDPSNPPTSPTFPISTPTTKNKYHHHHHHNNNNHNPFRLPGLSQDVTRIVQLYHMHVLCTPNNPHVLCTPNNTHVLIRDAHGRPLKSASWSGGACGFKGVNRSGYEAGYQCAVRAFARVKQLVQEEGGFGGFGGTGSGSGTGVSRARLEVIFKGFGQGRDAVSKALMTSEGDDVRPYIVRV